MSVNCYIYIEKILVKYRNMDLLIFLKYFKKPKNKT